MWWKEKKSVLEATDDIRGMGKAAALLVALRKWLYLPAKFAAGNIVQILRS